VLQPRIAVDFFGLTSDLEKWTPIKARALGFDGCPRFEFKLDRSGEDDGCP